MTIAGPTTKVAIVAENGTLTLNGLRMMQGIVNALNGSSDDNVQQIALGNGLNIYVGTGSPNGQVTESSSGYLFQQVRRIGHDVLGKGKRRRDEYGVGWEVMSDRSTSTPFIVFALPRSRTAWLSAFLSYGDFTCGHEQVRFLRTLADVKSWLAQDFTGTAETNAAPWWRLILKYRPDIRVLVVRRDPDEAVNSLMALDMRGVSTFDRGVLRLLMQRMDAKLAQIERRMPNILSVSFDGLECEEVCASVFEHCLPYRHDRDRWKALSTMNIQCSMPGLMRYASSAMPQMLKMAAMAKQEILSDLSRGPVVSHDGITIAEEPLETFLRDGCSLFADHLVEVEESPDAFHDKNIPLMYALEKNGALQVVTARCNGRMFGYLMTVISPSLETLTGKLGVHTTFYASPEFRGLGLKLQRAAVEMLREKGVSEVVMRAGPRGAGARTGSLYRRLGAADDGHLYRLTLGAA